MKKRFAYMALALCILGYVAASCSARKVDIEIPVEEIDVPAYFKVAEPDTNGGGYHGIDPDQPPLTRSAE